MGEPVPEMCSQRTLPSVRWFTFLSSLSKQTLRSSTYKFNTFLPTGLQFNEKYDGTFVMNTMTNFENIQILPMHQQGDKAFYNNNNDTVKEVAILSIPLDKDKDNDTYTVQDIETGDLQKNNPNQVPKQHDDCQFPHLPQISHSAKVTLFLI